MKKLILFICISIFSVKSFSQINMGNLGTVTNGCGQTFYDSGGPSGDYSSSENYTATFCAPAGQYITFNFTAWGLGTGDQMNVYNGSSTSAALIGSYTSSPGQVSSTLGGCLTFVFTSDAPTLGIFATNGSGWAASISCGTVIPPPPPPPPGTCAAAQPFCTSTGATYPAATNTTAQTGPNYGCLGSEPAPAWFYLNIATSGNININLSDATSQDIDFALWGPFTTQAAMCAGTSAAPISCSYSTSATETAVITNAVAGQWYMMVITNYANTPTTIYATAGNASGVNGTTNCNILCSITGLTAVPGPCTPATNSYDVTGQITVSYPPTSGTLTVTNTCGASATVALPWTSPVSYTLPGNPANGGSCSVTATFSADTSCKFTTTYTAPASCNNCPGTAGNTGPFCEGTTIQLNAAGGTSYSWAGPNGYTSTLQNPTLPAATAAMGGTYTVTVTTGGGITCTPTTAVVVNPLPVTTVDSVTICTGTSGTLTAAGATTYSWNTGSTANPLSVSPTVNTTYTVTGTTAGCSSTAVGLISIANSLVITVNSPTICAGQSATLTATGANSYTWSAGVTAAAADTAVASPAVTTSYTVTGSNAAGCTGTAVATVTISNILAITVNSPFICVGQTAHLTASGATTYTWSGGATATGTNTADATPASTSTYTVTGTGSGCSGTAISTVTINPLPTATVSGGGAMCVGSPAPPVNIALTGVGPWNITYSDGTNNTSVTSAASPYIITNPAVGTYTVTLVSDANCIGTASGSATITIINPPVPSFTATPVIGCAPLCVNFTDASTPAGSVSAWNWNYGDGLTGTQQNPQYCYTTPGKYTVTLTASLNSNCSASDTVHNMITVNEVPIASFSAPATTSVFTPTVQFVDYSTSATSWNWNFGDSISTSNTSTVESPSHAYSQVGTYCVTLAVSNGFCTDTSTVCLMIVPEFTFYIPNAFSPNGDGMNDEFFGKGENIKDYEMLIYDRWGMLLFKTENINTHWDGRVKGGGIAQEDVYVYVINITDIFTKQHKYLGSVTIVR